MAVTEEIRFKRMQREYQILHDAQDDTLDKIDSFEAAVLGLTQVVAENRELILMNQQQIAENRELILANTRRLDDLTEKMDRLMTHLDVPPKPPMGFMKDEPPVD